MAGGKRTTSDSLDILWREGQTWLRARACAQEGCHPSRALLGGDGCAEQAWGELVDVDARLEAEGLRLVDKWHQLKVAINLGRLQREHANTKADASLAT